MLETRRYRNIMTQVAMRMKNRRMAMAYFSWVEFSEVRGGLRPRLSPCLPMRCKTA